MDKTAHLVNYELDSWGLQEMPGALNEAYADFFPAVVMDDPKIGRHVGPKLGAGSWLRDLEETHLCSQIDGEVHDDGRVWAGANWAAYAATGKDPALPNAVLAGLISLAGRASFQDAANATLAAAAGMPAAIGDALRAAYVSHGLLECGRAVPAAPGVPIVGILMNPLVWQWSVATMPFAVQHRVTVQALTQSLKVTVSAKDKQTGSALPASRVNVYANLGSQVVYGPSQIQASWSTAGQGALTIGSPAAGDYYLLAVGQDFQGSAAFDFQVDVELVGAPGLDAGPPGPDAAAPIDAAAVASGDASPGESDAGASEPVVTSGCGCLAAGSRAGLWPLLALTGAWWWWARRRFR